MTVGKFEGKANSLAELPIYGFQGNSSVSPLPDAEYIGGQEIDPRLDNRKKTVGFAKSGN